MYSITSCSSRGKRSYQQDRSYYHQYNISGFNISCLAVADGMGGHSDGHLAAEAAVAAVESTVSELFQYLEKEGVDKLAKNQNKNIEQILNRIFLDANKAVQKIESDEEDPEMQPGTTLVCAIIINQHLWVGNVGDSRACILSFSGLDQLTKDDTALQDAIDEGSITTEEAKHSPYGHILSRYLGVDKKVYPAITYHDLNEYQYPLLILSSDGFHESFALQDYQIVFNESDDCTEFAQNGINRAIGVRGSKDNATVVLGEYHNGVYFALRQLHRKEETIHDINRQQPDYGDRVSTGKLGTPEKKRGRVSPLVASISIAALLSVAAYMILHPPEFLAGYIGSDETTQYTEVYEEGEELDQEETEDEQGAETAGEGEGQIAGGSQEEMLDDMIGASDQQEEQESVAEEEEIDEERREATSEEPELVHTVQTQAEPGNTEFTFTRDEDGEEFYLEAGETSELPGGQYKWQASAPRHVTHSAEEIVELEEGEFSEIEVQLTEKRTVELNTEPEGAKVELIGETHGREYRGETPLEITVKPDRYQFLISKLAYDTLNESTNLKKEDKSLEKKLDRITPQQADTIKDRQGNTYETLKIAGQTWMAQNLRVTEDSNGDEIPRLDDDGEWSETNSPASAVIPHDDEDVIESYGMLYNWHAVDERELCPEGWRVPDKKDWNRLIEATDLINNEKLQNELLTKVKPGYRTNNDGRFVNIDKTSHFWSTHKDNNRVKRLRFGGDEDNIKRYTNKNNGFSVRCIKKQE